MIRICFLLIVAMFFNLSLYSQKMYWDKKSLTISKILYNGYTLNNESDNTIKIKIYNGFVQDKEFIIPPQGNCAITYSNYLDRYTFSNYSVHVFYDLECYNYDLEKINKIARQRISNAELKIFFKSLLRIVGLAEHSKNENMHEIGKISNNIAEVLDIYDEYNKNGFSKNTAFKIINILGIEKKSKWEKIADNLMSLYEYNVGSTNVNLKDLEMLAIELAAYVSDNSIFNYSIDYETQIRPVIDYDGDDVPNIYDECPNQYGLSKYNGCTKEYYKEKRKKQINTAVKHVWLDLGYTGKKIGELQLKEITSDVHSHAFYANIMVPFIKHKYSNKVFGAFGIDVDFKAGSAQSKTIKFTTSDTKTGDVLNSYEEKLKIKEQSVSTGLSYNLFFSHAMLQSKIGIVPYSNQITDAYKENLYYAALTVRFYNTLFFGARYQKLPDLTYPFHDYTFTYPNEQIYYYIGLTVAF